MIESLSAPVPIWMFLLTVYFVLSRPLERIQDRVDEMASVLDDLHPDPHDLDL